VEAGSDGGATAAGSGGADIINGDEFDYSIEGSTLTGTATLSDGNMQPLGVASVEVDCG
jgi:hypothetical protein